MKAVFLALSPSGLQEAIKLAADNVGDVWCGSDAISEAEYRELGVAGVSRFSYPLFGESSAVLAGAISTIEEHHPRQRLWVEHVYSEP